MYVCRFTLLHYLRVPVIVHWETAEDYESVMSGWPCNDNYTLHVPVHCAATVCFIIPCRFPLYTYTEVAIPDVKRHNIFY